MKTSTLHPSEPQWYVVDAKGQSLGRLSTQIAHVLRGKHKPEWSPHQIHSDHVVIINASEVALHGKKAETKEYMRHSGHFGHLKRIPFSRMIERKPENVLIHAIKGMLPRNKLRAPMIKHLHVYAGMEHPHEAQQPKPFPNS